jgi:hypothetical protein
MTTILQKIAGAINALQLTPQADYWLGFSHGIIQSDYGKSTPNAVIRLAFQQRPAR